MELFSVLFFVIIACQIYGLIKGLTATLAMIIGVLCAIYGLTLVTCSPFFGILWFLIAAYYFYNYKNLC